METFTFSTCPCVHAKSFKLYLTLFNPVNCSLPGSSVHGILQARILEWVAMPSSRRSSLTQGLNLLSCVVVVFSCCSVWWYCSVAQSCLTFCDPMNSVRPASLSFTIPLSLLKLMSIESVIPSNHLILCRLLLLLLSIFPSIRIFSNESALHIRWPKYWSLSFRINPSKKKKKSFQ